MTLGGCHPDPKQPGVPQTPTALPPPPLLPLLQGRMQGKLSASPKGRGLEKQKALLIKQMFAKESQFPVGFS